LEGGIPEGGISEGGIPEGGIPEGGIPEGGLSEGGLPEGEIPEGGIPEGGILEGGVPVSPHPSPPPLAGGIPSGSCESALTRVSLQLLSGVVAPDHTRGGSTHSQPNNTGGGDLSNTGRESAEALLTRVCSRPRDALFCSRCQLRYSLNPA